MRTPFESLVGVVAGLMGAAGVAASAAGAHSYNATNLATAGTMLLIHAAALTALAIPGHGQPKIRRLAAGVLAVGTLLFSGDLACRAFLGVHAFPMAAPLGGLLMIAGWLIAALAYAGERR